MSRTVAVTLAEASCTFTRETPLPEGCSFEEFKDAVERAFDQRLQLSFERIVEQRGHAALSAGKTGLSAEVVALLAKSRHPRTSRHVVALTNKTWETFIKADDKKPLKCRAWSVFAGNVQLSAATEGKDTIPRFVSGTETLPAEKRLGMLRKRLTAMSAQHRATRSEKGPDLFRTLSREQCNGTVARLWQHASNRNTKRAEDEKLESLRLAAKLRLPPRRVERTPEEEAMVDTLLDEPLSKRGALAEELDAKYESLAPQPKAVAQLTPDEMRVRFFFIYPKGAL